MLGGSVGSTRIAGSGEKLGQAMHVLIVDDEADLVEEIAHGFERKGVATTVAHGVDEAIAALGSLPPGTVTVVLTDIRMPGRSGLDLAGYLSGTVPAIDAAEVVVMTGHGDFALALSALRSHVHDFINKPMNAVELECAVRRAHEAAMRRREGAREYLDARERWLEAVRKAGELAERIGGLEHKLGQAVAETKSIWDGTLKVISRLVAARGQEAGQHILRTQACVSLLINRLCHHPRFAAALADEGYCQMIVRAVPLYDIGKVGIPDSILQKAGRLSPDEMAIMQTHTTLGADSIAAAANKLLSTPGQGNAGDGEKVVRFLEIARQIAETHHEKWDGTGYPKGLAGEDIPLPGRLMAVADVFEALLSERPYRRPLSLQEAIGVVAAGRGTHFDADIVDAFTASPEELAKIATAPSASTIPWLP